LKRKGTTCWSPKGGSHLRLSQPAARENGAKGKPNAIYGNKKGEKAPKKQDRRRDEWGGLTCGLVGGYGGKRAAGIGEKGLFLGGVRKNQRQKAKSKTNDDMLGTEQPAKKEKNESAS